MHGASKPIARTRNKKLEQNLEDTGNIAKEQLAGFRVCQLTTGHSLDDERILHRIARSAREFGCESVIAGPGDGTLAFPTIEMISYPQLNHRLGPLGRLFVWIPVLWWSLRNRQDLYHIHDPDLVLVGLVLKLLRRKVIYDVHDDYEASFKDRLASQPFLLKWVPSCWWWFERRAAEAFDGVVVADRHLAAKFSRCEAVLLGNFPDHQFTASANTDAETTFNLLYVGGVTRARGVGVALEALRKLSFPDIRLHIVGSANEASLLEALQDEPRVVLHGRVPWTDLKRHYERAHVGLALYQPLEGFLYCPGENAVKVIEYMAAGIPVLTSDFPGLRAFVEGQGIGQVVKPDDPAAVAAVIDVLYHDDRLRRRLGTKGRTLFESEYNWERHKGRLLELYRRVLERKVA